MGNENPKIDKRYKIKVGDYYQVVMNESSNSVVYGSRGCKIVSISGQGTRITLLRIGITPLDDTKKGIYRTVCDDQIIDGKVFTKHVSWLINKIKASKAFRYTPTNVVYEGRKFLQPKSDLRYKFRVGDKFHIIPHYEERRNGPPSLYLTIVGIRYSKITLKRMGNSSEKVKLYDDTYIEGNTFEVDCEWMINKMKVKNLNRTTIGETL